jgi:hypothetical protein
MPVAGKKGLDSPRPGGSQVVKTGGGGTPSGKSPRPGGRQQVKTR